MRPRRIPVLLLVALLAGGCASVPPEERVAHDPWEGLNRKVHKFNDAVDGVVMKPIAKGYNKIIPSPVRTGQSEIMRPLPGIIRSSGATRHLQSSDPSLPDRQYTKPSSEPA